MIFTVASVLAGIAAISMIGTLFGIAIGVIKAQPVQDARRTGALRVFTRGQ